MTYNLGRREYNAIELEYTLVNEVSNFYLIYLLFAVDKSAVHSESTNRKLLKIKSILKGNEFKHMVISHLYPA